MNDRVNPITVLIIMLAGIGLFGVVLAGVVLSQNSILIG
jgi:hypothetical protein